MEGARSQTLLEEAREHFNEPVIGFHGVGRCVGYAEDADDCYLMIAYPRHGTSWHTFVGGYTYLGILRNQGQVTSATGEKWNDLTRLDHTLTCGGCPPRDEFLVTIYGAPSPRTE